MTRQAIVLIFVACTSLAVGGSASAATIALSLEPDGVSVADVTPGGQVALVALSRVAADAIVRVERRDELLTDDDRDGAVRLEVAGGPAARSVWVAVDLASGGWAVAYPAGYPARVLTLGRAGLAAQAAAFDQPGSELEVLLVRPGDATSAGVWRGALGDGAAGDADVVADGSLRVIPATLDRLGDRAAPDGFATGDILVLLDPKVLSHAVIAVPPPAAEGEGVTP